LIAYCTFINPRTRSAFASSRVCCLSFATISFESEYGGSEQALSPE